MTEKNLIKKKEREKTCNTLLIVPNLSTSACKCRYARCYVMIVGTWTVIRGKMKNSADFVGATTMLAEYFATLRARRA